MTALLPVIPNDGYAGTRLDQRLPGGTCNRDVRPDEATRRLLRVVQRQCSGEYLHARMARATTARDHARLKLARRVLREYFTQPAFHHELARSLLSASGGLLARALDTDSWLARDHGPEHELLALIGRVALGWSPGSDRGERIRGMLCGWLRELGTDRHPAGLVDEARERAQGLDQIRTRRTDAALEESGLSPLAARRHAATIGNRQLAGRDQPPFMIHDLHAHWFPALCRVFEEQGADSELARRLVRVFSLVIWGLQPGMETASRQDKLRRTAQQLNAELPALLPLVVPDARVRDAMIDHIEVALLSVLHGRQVARKPVPAFRAPPVPDDSAFDAQWPALVDRLDQNQWLQCDPDDLRVFLLARRDNADLVFADQFGRRVLTCQRDELLERLACREAWRVDEPVKPAELLRRRLAGLQRHRRARAGQRDTDGVRSAG